MSALSPVIPQERHNSDANTCHLCHCGHSGPIRDLALGSNGGVDLLGCTLAVRIEAAHHPATQTRDDLSSDLSRSTAFWLSGPMRQDHASRTLPQQKPHHPRECPSCLQ